MDMISWLQQTPVSLHGMIMGGKGTGKRGETRDSIKMMETKLGLTKVYVHACEVTPNT